MEGKQWRITGARNRENNKIVHLESVRTSATNMMNKNRQHCVAADRKTLQRTEKKRWIKQSTEPVNEGELSA